jgi:UDP-glucose 4-epimerase
MRVLLTGAAGYVGRAALEVLRRDHEVRPFDVVSIPREGAMAVGDIADFRTVTEALEGVDAVVHLAMVAAPGSYDTPELPMRVNVLGTANVLEAARRARIQRVVHMSSGAVVTGYSRDTFIHVELPYKFSGMYCLSKALEEHLCRHYAAEYGMTIIALRPWSAADGRTMTGKDGRPLRYDAGYFGLVCRYDLAEACELGLAANLTGFQPFHIMATDEAEKWFDMERTHRILGWTPKETFASLKPRQG